MRDSEGWRRVDIQYVNELWRAYISDPVCVACVKAVGTRLLSGGIVFTNKSYNQVASAEFQSHIDRYFSNFVKEALVQLNIMGFAFFYIDNDTPRVIQIGTADIRWRVNTDTFQVEIGVFRGNSNVPDPNIFSIVESLPDASGMVSSSMTSYYRSRTIQDTFIRNAITADYLNAVPPIYTMSSTDKVFDEREIANVGEVDGLRASMVNDEMRARTGLRLTDHQRNEQLVKQFNNFNDPASVARRIDPSTGLRNFDAGMDMQLQQVVPLPLDARVASAPRASARGDIVSIVSHMETLACVSFGVNIESIGLANRLGGHLGNETLAQVNQVTFNTCLRWSTTFQPVLLNIYEVVWGDSDKKDELTVLFPSMLAPTIVEKLYTTNILTHKAYCEYLSTNYRLPLDSFEKKDVRMQMVDAQIEAQKAVTKVSQAKLQESGNLQGFNKAPREHR